MLGPSESRLLMLILGPSGSGLGKAGQREAWRVPCGAAVYPRGSKYPMFEAFDSKNHDIYSFFGPET